MANFISPQKKNRYTIVIFSIIALFLMSILFFSKEALEPTLNFHTDLYYSRPLPVPTPMIHDDVFKADTGGFDPSVPQPAWQISEKGLVDSGFNGSASNGEVAVEEKTKPESQFVTDPGGVVPSIQEPSSQISEKSVDSGFNGSEVEEKTKPTYKSEFFSDPRGGLEPLMQESSSHISENESVDSRFNNREVPVQGKAVEEKKIPTYKYEFVSDPGGGLEPLIQEPSSQISGQESLDFGLNDREVTVDKKIKPVYKSEFVGDPGGGLEPSIQEPVSHIPGMDLVDSGIQVKETAVGENTTNVFDSNTSVKLFDNVGDVSKLRTCDLYMGAWVKDEYYPLYSPGSCPFVDEAFSCQGNGRPDSKYLKWRWKPDGCDLPRFNATDFLMRLRGKRLMLVGDSMNRNQFESLLCLLREGLPDKSRMYEVHGHKITKGRGYFVFKFMDYNCTVEFVRSHFLVREGVRINAQGNSNPTLSIDRIDKSARRWMQADILVFNTGHWWTHGKTARGKNYYKEGDVIYPQFDAVEAYRRSLRTWAKWINANVNPAKQLVFYRGYSSAHFRGGDWDSGGACNGETEPILAGAFLNNYPLKMKIVEEVIQETQVPVILLNVTRLTNFRKDGHPSVYGKNTTEGKKVSTRKQDCSHWCLPGVPDAWNELIYSVIYQSFSTSET